MNFLFLNSARRWGGNEKWTRMAAHALAREHGVWLAYRKKAVGSRFDVPRTRLPFLNEADFVTLAGVARLVLKHRVDVLIPTKPKDFVIAGIVSKLLRRKTLIRLGIVRDLKNSSINNFVYNRLNDGVIVNAPEIKETLLKAHYMKPEKIRVIFNGLDAEELDALASSESLPKPFPFTVCSLGELSGRKGMDAVIEGCSRFFEIAGSADAGLVLVGEGDQRPELEALVRRLGVEARVRFTGNLANPYPLLRTADAFVSASKNEGLSNALLEAMYLGVSSISTRAGGAKHAIEDGVNGFLIGESGLDEQIGRLLVRLFRNPELRFSLAEAGRRTVIQKFLLGRMTEEIAAFAEETLGRRGTSR